LAPIRVVAPRDHASLIEWGPWIGTAAVSPFVEAGDVRDDVAPADHQDRGGDDQRQKGRRCQGTAPESGRQRGQLGGEGLRVAEVFGGDPAEVRAWLSRGVDLLSSRVAPAPPLGVTS
jgi:hypothetical protein